MANLKIPIPQVYLDFIVQVEGCVLHKYRDSAGRWTIGVGHLIKPNETFPDVITMQEAQSILLNDSLIAASAVCDHVQVSMTTNQYAALISFTFNEGVAAFEGSTLLKDFNAGNIQGAAAQFSVWDKDRENGVLVVNQGLVNRRAKEIQLFLS